jgi:hypothetical protein
MKKIILIASLVIFSLGAFAITPDSKSKSENPAVPDKKENKLSNEEVNRLTRRAEELRDKDNTKQTVVVQEGRRSRRGNDGENRGNHRNGGVFFIGGGGLLLLIILIIILV